MYKKWALTVIGAIVFLLVCSATVSYIVDPYGIYPVTRKSFNEHKIGNRDPYLVKTYNSRDYQPETIVLGTSRAMRLDPPLIEQITGESTYNLGLSASNSYIQFSHVESLLKRKNNLKTIIIGLDFETFDIEYKTHVNFAEKRVASPFYYFQDIASTLLTKKSLLDSYYVLYDNVKNRDKYTKSSTLDDGSFNAEIKLRSEVSVNDLKRIAIQYEVSLNSIEYIKKIQDLCNEQDIQLYLYISPIHAIILETFWQMDQWPVYEDWKRQLVSIAPIWDFSGYHDISMSSLNHDTYYDDLSHFSKETGNLMVYRMLGSEDYAPPWFGVQITPDNIEEHLQKLRESRSQWDYRDTDMQELIQDY
ncbi:hypothetical protein [Paenibacillus paeoniae]|uniref:Uncharacterized protein n=1 Tax=Paenibacillus paeoniae TaxID=2292705 RepID=A0A371NZX9_9BACL|nr:hypothetical protein [Paenibacillus paeoniae]REK69234.1 hypothetical protein DX130_25305 [Paenibacillus paeoniae]